MATVLYVEDNSDNRLLIRRVLLAEGYQMLEAANAVEAVQCVRAQIPDMPDIDGYTLTSRLKSISTLKQVPIIALTANVMKGDRERSFEAGCDGYIQKPIDVDTLPQQIHDYLKR
jgi:two-component system cell cycle response regulator DivK